MVWKEKKGGEREGRVNVRAQCCLWSPFCLRFFFFRISLTTVLSGVPNSTTRTPICCTLYNTTNGQAHNNSITCCTTNLPHRNARAQHLDMSRCWNVVNFCPSVVNYCCITSCRIVVSSSVGSVRSRCPCSGVWHLDIINDAVQ